MNNFTVSCIVESGFKCIWKIENFDLYKHSRNLVLRSASYKVDMLHNSEWFLEINKNLDSLSLGIFKTRGDTKYNNIDYSVFIFTRCGWIPLRSWLCDKFKTGGTGEIIDNLIKWRHLENEKNGYLVNKSLIIGLRMWNGSTNNIAAQCLITSLIKYDNIFNMPLQVFTALTPGEVIELPLTQCEFSKETQEKRSLSKETTTTSTQTDYFGDSAFRESFPESLINTLTKNSKNYAKKNELSSPTIKKINNDSTQNFESSNIDMNLEDDDENFMSFLLHSVQPELLSNMTWDATKRLYNAAKKYNVPNLKKNSVLLLERKLSTENICETFLIADNNMDEELKNCALEYFVKNSKTVLHSLEWKDLKAKRPELTLEILSEFAEKLQNQ